MIGVHQMQMGYPEAGLKRAALCGVVMAVDDIGTDGRRGLRISQRPSRTSQVRVPSLAPRNEPAVLLARFCILRLRTKTSWPRRPSAAAYLNQIHPGPAVFPSSLIVTAVSPSLVTPPLVTLHSARVMNTLKNG
jgi:hypothetical protein